MLIILIRYLKFYNDNNDNVNVKNACSNDILHIFLSNNYTFALSLLRKSSGNNIDNIIT